MSKPAHPSPCRTRYTSERRWEKSSVKRKARPAAMLAENQERRRRHGPYAGERRRAAKYAKYLAEKTATA